MGRDGGIPGAVRHLDGFQRLGHGTDLIELDQNRIAAAKLNSLLQPLRIGHKQIVSHQLHSVSQLRSQLLPAFPVLFIQRILDGNDGIFIHQLLPVFDQLLRCKSGSRLWKHIFALFLTLPLAGSRVHGDHKILSRLIPRLLHRLQNVLNGFLITGEIRCKASLVTDRGGKSFGF